MAQTVIRWNLNELMAKHRIKGKDLAEFLKVRPATITGLRNSVVMPRIDGDRLEEVLAALNALALPETKTQEIGLTDLLEWQREGQSNA
ncbi:helix-turn-helix domain-containing protein [Oculatella sp. LEGE 06141]|uniref:helix-turn-helix domain-containing protein n=1 Tax=Oculatella sp. LEGE 06141 TaxID=1828648 RepID=UPI0018820DC6|nr:helix-turn-helix domain-containing protein [Oculatella sp. LEGE 06141]MBE9182400.1 helix-turn-helix domain-containing protein [Oculatella sp. LEGE 06141]